MKKEGCFLAYICVCLTHWKNGGWESTIQSEIPLKLGVIPIWWNKKGEWEKAKGLKILFQWRSFFLLILIFVITDPYTYNILCWIDFSCLEKSNYNYCPQAKITTHQLWLAKKPGIHKLPYIYLFLHVGCLSGSDFSKEEL